MQQQQQNTSEKLKQNFNFLHAVALWHQRAITVPMRDKYGTQALGLPCAFALILMFLWYLATHDQGILLWMGLWVLCFIKRRMEAVRLSTTGVHSWYDGWPCDAIKIGRTEKMAKLVVEPILVGILGIMALKGYEYMGWRPTGLPYFLLAGVLTLPFVETAKRAAWQRRLQGMADARVENEMAMRDFEEQYRP